MFACLAGALEVYSILNSCKYRVSCIEYRVSCIEYRVSCIVYRVLSIEYREINYPTDIINRQGKSVFSTFSLSLYGAEKSMSLGRIGATNRQVKFTLSKESCRACLKTKIKNFIVQYSTF